MSRKHTRETCLSLASQPLIPLHAYLPSYPGSGSTVKLAPVPSAPFKPTFRFVVSITSLPHDLDRITESLYSLGAGNQSLLPDQIYINLPYRSRRTGEEYVVPNWLETWPNVKILRSEIDYGPLTKLVPAIMAENDPSTVIVTMDNDQVFKHDTLKHIIWHAEQDPSVAWGICGWAFQWYPLPHGVVLVVAPWYLRSNGRSVDVLQAVCGIAYRRSFFTNVTLLANIHPDCFSTDDTWISGYLATITKVRRLLISGSWFAHWTLEPREISYIQHDRAHRLSTINNNVRKARYNAIYHFHIISAL